MRLSEKRDEMRFPDGIKCPDCDCPHLPVYYTRHRDGATIRVRHCRHCGRRVITRERAAA